MGTRSSTGGLVGEEGAGKGDELALADREDDAALFNGGGVTLAQAADEIVRAYGTGSRSGYLFTHSSETLLLNPNAPQMRWMRRLVRNRIQTSRRTARKIEPYPVAR